VLFSSVAFASRMSGAVYNGWGWDVLVRIVLPVAVLGLLGIYFLYVRDRRAAAN
jgi:hypothetical protein